MVSWAWRLFRQRKKIIRLAPFFLRWVGGGEVFIFYFYYFEAEKTCQNQIIWSVGWKLWYGLPNLQGPSARDYDEALAMALQGWLASWQSANIFSTHVQWYNGMQWWLAIASTGYSSHYIHIYQQIGHCWSWLRQPWIKTCMTGDWTVEPKIFGVTWHWIKVYNSRPWQPQYSTLRVRCPYMCSLGSLTRQCRWKSE